ncbi:MAG TPA: hypothetical protein VKE22_14370 [Haliangiales bacterium]|nr:hypothetical protein [Haliangiales bacterium]
MLGTVRLLLSCFVDASWDGRALLLALRPTLDDYLRVFRREAVADAYHAYEPVWAGPPEIPVARGVTSLDIAVATVEELRRGGGSSRRFPAAYREVAPTLRPGPSWVCWTFRGLGGGGEVRGDGLVAVEDHLVYFPQPWRVLDTVRPSP